MIVLMEWILFTAFIFGASASNEPNSHLFDEPITLHDIQGQWTNSEKDNITVKDTKVIFIGDEKIFEIEESDDIFTLNGWVLKKSSRTITWNQNENENENGVSWYRLAQTLQTQTSKYKAVYWDKVVKAWRGKFQYKCTTYFGKYFDNQVHAAMSVNLLCDELVITRKNPTIDIKLDVIQQRKEKISKYKGVHWQKENKKWCAEIKLKGQTRQYGGIFDDELDAAKKVNELCKEFEIPLQNRGINRKQKTSQYVGVHKHKKTQKWFVQIKLKGQPPQYGGIFSDEEDAAKQVNKLCKKFEIPLQNPGINGMPNQQQKKKTPQYKGVFWNKKNEKWYALIHPKGQKPKYGGSFNNEVDAAKKVNELCEEFEIPLKNPGINGMPNQQQKVKSSQYKGVYKQVSGHWPLNAPWCVALYMKGEKQAYGGYFHNEIDAAIKVNQLCEEYRLPPPNPTIDWMPNQELEAELRRRMTDGIVLCKLQQVTQMFKKHNIYKRLFPNILHQNTVLWSIFGPTYFGVKEIMLKFLIIDYDCKIHILQDERTKKRKRKITDIQDYLFTLL